MFSIKWNKATRYKLNFKQQICTHQVMDFWQSKPSCSIWLTTIWDLDQCVPAQKEYECVGIWIDVCAYIILYVNYSVIRKIQIYFLLYALILNLPISRNHHYSQKHEMKIYLSIKQYTLTPIFEDHICWSKKLKLI